MTNVPFDNIPVAKIVGETVYCLDETITELQIIVEVDDLSQTSALFTMFDEEHNCLVVFSVPLNPKECMCDNEVKILNTNCYRTEGRFFYNIDVEICNTNTEHPLHFDHLNANVYKIHNWTPPFVVQPGECDTLHITVEVDDFSQTSAIFTMFDNKHQCFIVFSVLLNPKKCVCSNEVEIIKVDCDNKDCKLFYDIEVEICNTGATPLLLDELNGYGYTIHNWLPLYVDPAQCETLKITIEVDNISQSSVFLSLFEREKDGCYVEFFVQLPDWKSTERR